MIEQHNPQHTVIERECLVIMTGDDVIRRQNDVIMTCYYTVLMHGKGMQGGEVRIIRVPYTAALRMLLATSTRTKTATTVAAGDAARCFQSGLLLLLLPRNGHFGDFGAVLVGVAPCGRCC